MTAALSALIIDPSGSSRVNCVEAMHIVGQFGRVTQCGLFSKAKEHLHAESGEIDLVFISSRLPEPEIAAFIALAKDFPQARDSAFVVILSGKDRERVNVAESTLGGADGCLTEPYGAAHLEQIARLARKVREQRRKAREAAIGLLVDESIVYLDAIAKAELSGVAPGDRLRYFRRIGAVLIKLNENNLERYFEIATTKFTSYEPQKFIVQGPDKQPLVTELDIAEVEDRYLHEAIERLKLHLGTAGINYDFLDTAASRIVARMKLQGIQVEFTDRHEDAHELERKKARERLKQLFLTKNVQAEFVSDMDESE